MTNFGKWNNWYSNIKNDNIEDYSNWYGDGITYLIGSAFFADVDQVEDWGCGTGGFKKYCKTKYVGIDGSCTPFADKIADLESYKSYSDGILIRHVLEHNYNWESILNNAILSFKKKLLICLFTPFSEKTMEINHNINHGVDVPDISFSKIDIEKHFNKYNWTLLENIETKTQYNKEHIYLIWK